VGVDEAEGLTDGLTRDDEGGAQQRKESERYSKKAST